MPGPKYGDFKFPSDFGFSGSSGQTTTVRSHERRMPQRYAKGGAVKRSSRPPLRPSPEQVVGGTIAAGAAAAAYDKHRRNQEAARERERLSVEETLEGGVRRRRERELGLKRGGSVGYRKGGKMRGRKDC